MSATMNCPTTDELNRLMAGPFDQPDATAFLRHVDHCVNCQLRLDRIGNLNAVPSSATKQENASDYGPAFFQAIDALLNGSRNNSNLPHSALGQVLQPSLDPQALGRLGHYEALELLGQGGMGVVLRAHDTVLNRDVAIKILAPHLAHQVTARERFAREARAVAAINHDNVLSVFSVSEVAGLPYLVMPYVTGRSLAEKLEREHRLPMAEVLRIGLQTAQGLAAAHTAGIVHRDIKPSNLLLEGDDERVKIADFGLATVVDGARLTQTGTLAGTPEFMAPEQARDEAVDLRADLFSLGVVLYLMSTGQSPFRAATPLASLRRVCDDQPRLVAELNPEASAWFAAVVERLLQKSPADRYSTAGEVAESLGDQLAALHQPRRPAPRVAAPTISDASSDGTSSTATLGQPVCETASPGHQGARALAALTARLSDPRNIFRNVAWLAAGCLLIASLIGLGYSMNDRSEVTSTKGAAVSPAAGNLPDRTQHPVQNSAQTTKPTTAHPSSKVIVNKSDALAVNKQTSTKARQPVSQQASQPRTQATAQSTPQFDPDVHPIEHAVVAPAAEPAVAKVPSPRLPDNPTLAIHRIEPLSGAFGDTVTIIGVGLAQAKRVLFYVGNGCKPAAFEVDGEKLLVAVPEWLRPDYEAVIVVETPTGVTTSFPNDFVWGNDSPPRRLNQNQVYDYRVVTDNGTQRDPGGAVFVQRGGAIAAGYEDRGRTHRHGPYFITAGASADIHSYQLTVYHEPEATLSARTIENNNVIATPRITISNAGVFTYKAAVPPNIKSEQPPSITHLDLPNAYICEVIGVRGTGLAETTNVEVYPTSPMPVGFRVVSDSELRVEMPSEMYSIGDGLRRLQPRHLIVRTPLGVTVTMFADSIVRVTGPYSNNVNEGATWVKPGGIFNGDAELLFVDKGGVVLEKGACYRIFLESGARLDERRIRPGIVYYEPGTQIKKTRFDRVNWIEVPSVSASVLSRPFIVVNRLK